MNDFNQTPAGNSMPNASARCWELAVKIFNTTLTNDPKKLIQVTAPSLSYTSASFSTLIDTAEQSILTCPNEKGDLRKAMESCLLIFNRYAQSIDVLIQHQPHVTAVVWGSVRTLMQIACNEIEISISITTAVGKIVGEIGRWDRYLRMYSSSDRILSVTARLFAQMINYLVRAIAFYTAPTHRRYAKAGLSTAPTKLRDAWLEIVELSSQVEKESNLASSERSEAIYADLTAHIATSQKEVQKQELYRQDSLISVQASIALQRQGLHRLQVNQRLRAADKIIKWLHQSHSSCTASWEPGTAEWLLSNAVYVNWDKDTTGVPLWIHGIPGCGKSVLAKFIVARSKASVTIAHFLEAAVNEALTKSISVAASILLQLFSKESIVADEDLHQTMVDRMLPLLDHFRAYEDCPSSRLWEVIEEIAGKLGPFMLVVDALDECYTGGDAPTLTRSLKHLARLPCARIIILSRRHPSLEDLLQDSVQLRMDNDTVGEDISLFIRNVVKRTPKIRISHDLIVNKARNQAGGMFLWTDLMLKYLQQAPTPRMQRLRLERIPVGLSPIYERLLEEAARNMEPDQLTLRKSIFMLLAAATTPLSPDDIAVALALDGPDVYPDADDLLIDPNDQINTLCWPFTNIVADKVQFVHYSMQEYLLIPSKVNAKSNVRFTLQESNDYMALKCMFRLINPHARSVSVISALLRSHMIDNSGPPPSAAVQLPHRWPFYQYACCSWHLHLVQSGTSLNLLGTLSIFLRDAHFIAWVETFIRVDTDLGTIVAVNAALCAWHASLSDQHRQHVSIADFMGKAYNDFYSRIEIRRNMPEVALMALRRLGLYHNMNGTTSGERSLIELRRLVSEGFTATLGEQHPLTLRSTTEWCIERLVDEDRQLLAGETLLLKTMELQREVLGLNVSDSFYTQLYAGRALYFRARFDEAMQHLEECYKGLERTLGPNHQHFQIARLFHTYAVEGKLDYEKASHTYENIWQVWSKVQGIDHPLSVATECNLGVVYRKMRRFDLAEKHLLHSFAERQRLFGNCSVTVDGSIQLALLYREMRRAEEARAYLEVAETVGLRDHGFERYCQVQHLQALLHLDAGELARARDVLDSLLQESNRQPPNRAILWARLTLADICRSLGEIHRVPSLFTDIVRPIKSSNEEQHHIEAAEQLCAAEQFLHVARERGLSVAEEQLRLLGLEWCLPEGFWIIFGGPAAEVYYEGVNLSKA